MGGGVYRLPKSLRLTLSDFCGFPYKPEQGEGNPERAAERESSGANADVPAELPEAHPAGAVSLGARQEPSRLCWQGHLESMSLSRPSRHIDVGKLAVF